MQVSFGRTLHVWTVIPERTKREVAKPVTIGVFPLQGFRRESVGQPERMSGPSVGWVGPTITVGVSAAQSVKKRGPTHFGAGIALMTRQSVPKSVAIRISPLRRLVNERITKVRPAIAVGVLAAPAVSAGGRTDRSAGHRGAHIGRGPTRVVPSTVAIRIMPLRRVFRPSIA